MYRTTIKELLKKYAAGTANEEEEALIDHWYQLLYNHNFTALSEAELNAVEQEMWGKIKQEAKLVKEPPSIQKTPIRKMIFRWAAAAAIIAAVVFGINMVFFTPQESIAYRQGKEQNGLTEVRNTSSVIKKVQLEDGSLIVLQPSSRLAYPKYFTADKREVYLEGEAFFEVKKDPSRPFLVHSGNLVTQVLGTSFTIKPDKDAAQIIVSVKTGKVVVFEDTRKMALNNEQKKNNGIIITPNQKVVYDETDRHFTTLLVENPEPVLTGSTNNIASASLSFDEASLAVVLEKVGGFYAIDILVENENIYQCRFTGNLTGQSLYDQLSAICQATNHQYEIKGTKILIKGKGCK